MSEPVPKSTKRYVALFDFTSKVNMSDAPGTLLSFKKGEYLYRSGQKTMGNQDWFFGKDSKQREGWFPESVVERSRPTRKESYASDVGLSVTEFSQNALASINQDAVIPNLGRRQSLTPPEETLECIKVVRAIKANTTQTIGDLAFEEDEIIAVYNEVGDGSFLGYTLDGKKGRFATKLVSVIHSKENEKVVLGRKMVFNNKSSAPPTIRTAASSKRLVEGGADSSQRNKIVREILTTELAYCKNLEEICVKYKTPMEQVPGEWKVITPILFQNVSLIWTLSKLLVDRLDEMVASWKSLASSVSAPFLELGPFFVAYEQYCRGFEAAQKRMDALATNAAFKNFLSSSKAVLPLDSLIVMPVQRVPRYKMLLTDLIRHTPESHPDLPNLKDALSMISVLAQGINEKIRSSETTQKLLDDGRDKELLSKYVTGERTVLFSIKDAEIKIDQAKSMVGKLKGDVYILSDALLILLRRHVRSDLFPWLDEFSQIYWPTGLLWVHKATLGGVHVGGPLFGLTIKHKKGEKELVDLLGKEIQKHKGAGAESVRTGGYLFGETGIKYEGEWRGGHSGAFMDGKGSIALGLGSVYIGTFVKNEMTGDGKMKLPSGDLLSGRFERGVLTGEASVDFFNGDTFRGKYVSGVRQGMGTFRSNTLEYQGEWKDDNAHGKGKLTLGMVHYDGYFEEGVFYAGEYKAADGSVYKGQQFTGFNMLEGKGSIRSPDGSYFVGIFKLGLRDGEGRHEYADGSVLAGIWRHDLPNGNCTWTGGANQWLKSFQGLYVDGRPHCKSALAVYSDGSQFQGSFKFGFMEKGELIHADGSIVAGKFKNGRFQGKTSYMLQSGDALFEGIVEHNRIPAKHGFSPVALPVTRPSFPINLAQGCLPGNGSIESTHSQLKVSAKPSVSGGSASPRRSK